MLSSSLRASGHPLSRQLYQILDKNNILSLDEFNEHTGKGISSGSKGSKMKIGSSSFVKESETETKELNKTAVHISSNEEYKGCYIFKNSYREGLAHLFKELGENKQLFILSGDNDGEKEKLENMLPLNTKFYFNQKT